MIEHKNTIIAVVLSVIVVVGWQYFIGYPQMEKQRQEALLKQQEQAQQQPAAQPGAPATPAPQAVFRAAERAGGSAGTLCMRAGDHRLFAACCHRHAAA